MVSSDIQNVAGRQTVFLSHFADRETVTIAYEYLNGIGINVLLQPANCYSCARKTLWIIGLATGLTRRGLTAVDRSGCLLI